MLLAVAAVSVPFNDAASPWSSSSGLGPWPMTSTKLANGASEATTDQTVFGSLTTIPDRKPYVYQVLKSLNSFEGPVLNDPSRCVGFLVVVDQVTEVPETMSTWRSKYPWAHFQAKPRQNFGQAHSLNIILSRLRQTGARFWLRWEDSWVASRPFIARALSLLTKPATTEPSGRIIDVSVADGHMYHVRKGKASVWNDTRFFFVYQREVSPAADKVVAEHCDYYTVSDASLARRGEQLPRVWPGFSLRPAVSLAEPILSNGPFDTQQVLWPWRFETMWACRLVAQNPEVLFEFVILDSAGASSELRHDATYKHSYEAGQEADEIDYSDFQAVVSSVVQPEPVSWALPPKSTGATQEGVEEGDAAGGESCSWTGVPPSDGDAEPTMQCGVMWFLHIPKTGGSTMALHFHENSKAQGWAYADMWKLAVPETERASQDSPDVAMSSRRWAPWKRSRPKQYWQAWNASAQWAAAREELRSPKPKLIVHDHHNMPGLGDRLFLENVLRPMAHDLARKGCEMRFTTLLREPSSELLSLLRFNKIAPADVSKEVDMYANGMSKYVVFNFNTQWPAEISRPPGSSSDDADEALLQESLAILQSFSLVGRTEELPPFMRAVNHALGWPLDLTTDAVIPGIKRDLDGNYSVTHDQLAQIKEATKIDSQLYLSFCAPKDSHENHSRAQDSAQPQQGEQQKDSSLWELVHDHDNYVVINDEYKLVYIDVPKAASTSIRVEMEALGATKSCNSSEWQQHASPKCCPQGNRGLTTSVCLTQKHLDEYFVFSFVRHPVDKFESGVKQICELQRHRNDPMGLPAICPTPASLLTYQLEQTSWSNSSKVDPDPNWVNRHLTSSPWLLTGRTSLNKPMQADFVGRIEHFDEDLEAASRLHCVKIWARTKAGHRKEIHRFTAADIFSQETDAALKSGTPCGSGLEIMRKSIRKRNVAGDVTKRGKQDDQTMLSKSDMRRFCKSSLYGEAYRHPDSFRMPRYHCMKRGASGQLFHASALPLESPIRPEANQTTEEECGLGAEWLAETLRSAASSGLAGQPEVVIYAQGDSTMWRQMTTLTNLLRREANCGSFQSKLTPTDPCATKGTNVTLCKQLHPNAGEGDLKKLNLKMLAPESYPPGSDYSTEDGPLCSDPLVMHHSGVLRNVRFTLVAALCTHAVLPLALAPSILKALQAAPYGFTELSRPTLVYVHAASLHYMHTEMDRAYGSVAKYHWYGKHFDQLLRSALTDIQAAVPNDTALVYFLTHAICDEKLSPVELKVRVKACAAGDDAGCFDCIEGQKWMNRFPAACEPIKKSLRQEFNETLMSGLAARHFAERESAVLREAAFRSIQVVDGYGLTTGKCNETIDGRHYEGAEMLEVNDMLYHLGTSAADSTTLASSRRWRFVSADHTCPEGEQNPLHSECHTAVMEAADGDVFADKTTKRKYVTAGPDSIVPAGCSYNAKKKIAVWNAHPSGGLHPRGTMYKLVCRRIQSGVD